MLKKLAQISPKRKQSIQHIRYCTDRVGRARTGSKTKLDKKRLSGDTFKLVAFGFEDDKEEESKDDGFSKTAIRRKLLSSPLEDRKI